MSLVILYDGLAEVEDGRRPKPHEDRRLAPAREVQRQRDQDGDERPAHVDSLATVQCLSPPPRVSVGVYPVADPANRLEVAAYPAPGPKFAEEPF